MTEISALPDEVLDRILAMVPMEAPVFAAVCKRWRNLVPENLRTWNWLRYTKRIQFDKLQMDYIIMYKKKELLNKFIAKYYQGEVVFLRTIVKCVKRNQFDDAKWLLSSPLLNIKGLDRIRFSLRKRKLSPEMSVLLFVTNDRLR